MLDTRHVYEHPTVGGILLESPSFPLTRRVLGNLHPAHGVVHTTRRVHNNIHRARRVVHLTRRVHGHLHVTRRVNLATRRVHSVLFPYRLVLSHAAAPNHRSKLLGHAHPIKLQTLRACMALNASNVKSKLLMGF